jgi:hypothetical protein
MPTAFVYVAEMDTEHYKWVAVGRTAKDAEAALAARWNKHVEDVGRHDPEAKPPSWKKGFGGGETSETVGDYYGMWVRRMRVGQGYMEDEEEK